MPPTSESNPTPSEVDPYEGVLPASPPIGTTADEWFTAPDGLRRHFRLYAPSSVGQRGARPLLIALHGGLGTSAQFATNSGFDGLAESNGFVVVYPDGIGARPDGSGYQTWNGGYCCGPAARLDVDDVSFVRALIDLIESRMEIDPDRVFAAGHSNGAIMAYRLACELSDRIVAIGIQAGSLGVDECVLQAPVSVLHIHGMADANHPIDGGRGTGIAGVVFRSARVAVRRLAEADGCESGPLLQSNLSWPDIEIRTWTGCEGVAEVRLITVEGASHAWMGHAAASAMAAGFVGEPYPGFDSSRAIWSFLSLHPRRSD
ncbi:MAG: alpha/beta hydrolase family esterase [Actinomycetota bacterium]